MTKQELVDEVCGRADAADINLTKKAAASILDDLFSIVSAEVASSGRFSYPEFGTFSKKHRKARAGKNPRTGEALQIPASNSVNFKPAPSLKSRLNP